MAEISIGQAEAFAEERVRLRSLAMTWSALLMLLLPILGLLGLFMRSYQTQALLEVVDVSWFYASMTLHGLGFVGLSYTVSFVAMLYVLSRHVSLNPRVIWVSTALTVLGVVLLVICFLMRFAPGWYFLYPLPFVSAGGWSSVATDLFLAAVAALGVAWLLWELELLRAIASRYSLSQALGWHYLRGSTTPELPPVVLVATVCAIAGIAALLAAVAMLIMMLVHRFTGNMVDPLVVKNLTFFFGHVLINLAMYHGIGFLYAVFPEYSGHAWKAAKPMIIAWNCVLFLVMFAYFHHLYMDFAQPRWVQTVGQIASYGTAIPAAVVTILGVLAQVYRRQVRWTLASALLFFGTMGWAVGGVAAVLDSTIAINFRFHNTLWVPAHFHTYLLVGIVLIMLGFVAHLTHEISGRIESPWMARAIVTLLLVGGYGFVMMFYLSGAYGVPRRYALYPPEVEVGTTLARVALVFVAMVALGLLLYLIEVGRRWFAAQAVLRSSPA
ncbi:MAG: cbb3-type cytochrome c oxidase subunit I [Armatimonadota bacterium]